MTAVEYELGGKKVSLHHPPESNLEADDEFVGRDEELRGILTGGSHGSATSLCWKLPENWGNAA